MNSPWSWLSGTMWDEARDFRRALIGGTVSLAEAGVTWYLKGPRMALSALSVSSTAWSGMQDSWNNWERDYRRPKRTYEEWKDANSPIIEVVKDTWKDYWRDHDYSKYGWHDNWGWHDDWYGPRDWRW